MKGGEGVVRRVELSSHRTGGFPVAPAAVDAADLGLGAGQGQTLEVRPEGGGQETVWTWQPTEVIVSVKKVPGDGQVSSPMASSVTSSLSPVVKVCPL